MRGVWVDRPVLSTHAAIDQPTSAASAALKGASASVQARANVRKGSPFSAGFGGERLGI